MKKKNIPVELKLPENMLFNMGNNLAALRTYHGYTQEQVAEILKLSTSAYSKYEQSRCFPQCNVLYALSELYGVTAELILKGNQKEVLTYVITRSSNTIFFEKLVSECSMLACEDQEKVMRLILKLRSAK